MSSLFFAIVGKNKQKRTMFHFTWFSFQSLTLPSYSSSLAHSLFLRLLDYVGHVYARAEGVAGVVIADKEYPPRVAFSLLNKILDEFTTRFPNNQLWTPEQCSYPELQQYIVTYQDPKQGDTIMKVQRELDETKIILHKTIESVLERGEKMENLVERSDVLSSQSKMFYKTAKKQNACCVIC